MRVGILTFHFGNNYGGILQCYALQQVVNSLGNEVEIINYRPQAKRTLKRVIGRLREQSSLKSVLRLVIEGFSGRRKSASALSQDKAEILSAFDTFRQQHLHISPTLREETIGEYANGHYDLIIVGSDQVWTSFYDRVPVYFMGWKPAFLGKKISYAACSAYTQVSGKRSTELSRLLKSFDKITVRDNTTAQLVENLTENIPPIVPDPSLLYDYSEFLDADIVPQKPYILTYILGDEIEGGHENALKKIKEAVGDLPVHTISIPGNSADINSLANKVYCSLSPNEWVAMFRHATYVYTDSFHAIMFSLKFGVPFTAYYRNLVRSSRMLDLKARGITSIIGNVDEIQVQQSVKNSIDCLIDGFNINHVFDGF